MISEKRYSGTGSLAIFPIEFKILGEDYLRVTVDGDVIATTTFDIINNSVVFNADAIPASGTANVIIYVSSSVSELGDLPANQSSIDTVAANIASINEVAELDTVAIAASATTASEAATAAEASAASVNLPTIASGDVGKILEVNVAEDAYDLVDKETGLPATAIGDASKHLTVLADGTGFELTDAPSGVSLDGADGMLDGAVTLVSNLAQVTGTVIGSKGKGADGMFSNFTETLTAVNFTGVYLDEMWLVRNGDGTFDTTAVEPNSGGVSDFYTLPTNLWGIPFIEGASILPAMTSNSAPSGVATSSSMLSSTFDPFKAMDKDIATSWITNSTSSGWIQYESSSASIVTSYTLLFRSGQATQMAKDWRLLGSNTGYYYKSNWVGYKLSYF